MKTYVPEAELHPNFGCDQYSFPGAHVERLPLDPIYARFSFPDVAEVITYLYTERTPSRVLIDDINVLTSGLRGQGFGTSILGWALEDSKERGAEYADLCIINFFVIGAIERVVSEGKAKESFYIKNSPDFDIYPININEALASQSIVDAAEAARHMKETEETGYYFPAVRSIVRL